MPWHDLEALLVDLDGVVTWTARVHAEAWKTTFDEYLKERAVRQGDPFRPFDLEQDYKLYVDGMARQDGVATFLRSRNIRLPRGTHDDPPDRETIFGLGNRKNLVFLEKIRKGGVDVSQGAVHFLRRAKSLGLSLAVVSASRNCSEILAAVGLTDLFDTQVDGIVAQERQLKGKPAPDTFVEAARRLGVAPRKAAVIEDAISGGQAGRAGGFGLVIGVGRPSEAEVLRTSGADLVVSDLGDLTFELGERPPAENRPSALACLPEIRARLHGRRAVVFLDYDGTLTSIAEQPGKATLSDEMRAMLRSLAAHCPVAVVSGRALKDVREKVGLEDIIYAGSHGFAIAGPDRADGLQHEEGMAFVPHVAQAASELRARLGGIKGAIIEDKTYAVAVHYREVADEDLELVESAVDEAVAKHGGLRKTRGKKVFELRPDIAWDKGKAVLWLLEALKLDRPDVVPIYLGDDLTDRDAFEALRGRGISILIAEGRLATSADFRLSDPDEVRSFLGELTAMLAEQES